MGTCHFPNCLTRPPLLPVVKDLPAQPVFVSRTLGPDAPPTTGTDDGRDAK